MAQLHKVEGQVELRCSAEKLFEVVATKPQQIQNICSNKVPNIQAHQRDWISVGTTRTWDFVIDGKSESLMDRIEAVDEKNKKMNWSIIGGEIMKTHYKTMATQIHVTSKGSGGGCILKFTIEYEKLNEVAPQPLSLLHFVLGAFKDLGSHLAIA